jgi:hypothetical protein
MADFIEFQRMVKKGKFGKIYGSFDMPTFFQWLDTFCEMRTVKISDEKRLDAVKVTREPFSQKTKEMYSELLEKLKPKKVFTESKIEVSEEQKIINGWIEDFKKKAGKINGFIEYEGKMVGIHEYLEIRNAETH